MPEQMISFNVLHPQPLLIVISGTSGVGKDAVIRGLKKRNLALHFVVTATSRLPRANEIPGVDYLFFSREEFEERIKKGEFIEHALVYDDYKGVPKWQIDQALQSGKDVILKLDTQGAETIRRLYPQAVLVFLVPKTTQEWVDHLTARNSETKETLSVRVETARAEVAKIELFDYAVVNAHEHLEAAVDEIIEIINVEHLRVHHRKTI
jgi:guanylate kinase